jgi:hypothetical protein
MGRESVDGVDSGPDRDALAKDTHRVLSIDDPSCQRTYGGEADENYTAILTPKIDVSHRNPRWPLFVDGDNGRARPPCGGRRGVARRRSGRYRARHRRDVPAHAGHYRGLQPSRSRPASPPPCWVSRSSASRSPGCSTGMPAGRPPRRPGTSRRAIRWSLGPLRSSRSCSSRSHTNSRSE